MYIHLVRKAHDASLLDPQTITNVLNKLEYMDRAGCRTKLNPETRRISTVSEGERSRLELKSGNGAVYYVRVYGREPAMEDLA